MKIGVIDVGGGLRGSYTAGVYDWCHDNDIRFDYCMGISAGSANLSSYLAWQRGRNLKFYTDYDLRPECMGMKNYLKTRNFVDLEYVYGDLSNSYGEYPLDYDAVNNNPAEFTIVATDAETGKPHYFTKADIKRDDFAPIKASSCVPAANKPYMVNGRMYYDGGISDPIPVEKCFEDGCDKVVLLLTRPRDFVRNPDKDKLTSALIRRKYPAAADAMSRRAVRYNVELWLAKQYEKKGKLLIVAPDDIGKMSTLTKDPEMIEALYYKGYRDAEVIREFVK
ncbi:MAG: patatin family protein [Mogibacterium sp.]|nr:patatin family protein [Mogibacterium sp.]